MTQNEKRTLGVILAAGRGSRVEGLPDAVNKCALPIRGDVSSISHMARVLIAAGVTRLCVSVGHASSSVRAALEPLRDSIDICFVDNAHYASSGCNYSLALALAAGCGDDIDQVVVVEGDSLHCREAIIQMVHAPSAAVLLRDSSYINRTRSFIAVGHDDSVLRFAYDARHKDVLSAVVCRAGETVLGESMDVWTFGGKGLSILKGWYLPYAKDVKSSRGPFFRDEFLTALDVAGVPMRPVFAKRPDEWINMNTSQDIEKAAGADWLVENI